MGSLNCGMEVFGSGMGGLGEMKLDSLRDILHNFAVREWLLDYTPERRLTPEALTGSFLYSLQAENTEMKSHSRVSNNLFVPNRVLGSLVLGTIFEDFLPKTQCLRVGGFARTETRPLVRRFIIDLTNPTMMLEFDWYDEGYLVVTYRSFNSYNPQESRTLHFESAEAGEIFPSKVFCIVQAQVEASPGTVSTTSNLTSKKLGRKQLPNELSSWSNLAKCFIANNAGSSVLNIRVFEHEHEKVTRIRRAFHFAGSECGLVGDLRRKAAVETMTMSPGKDFFALHQWMQLEASRSSELLWKDFSSSSAENSERGHGRHIETNYHMQTDNFHPGNIEMHTTSDVSIGSVDENEISPHMGIKIASSISKSENRSEAGGQSSVESPVDPRWNAVKSERSPIHKRGGAEGKSKSCTFCGKQFMKNSGLLRHIQTVHEGQRPYACDECGSTFQQKGHLRVHIRTKHDKTVNFQCEFCGSSFSVRSNMLRHQRALHSDATGSTEQFG